MSMLSPLPAASIRSSSACEDRALGDHLTRAQLARLRRSVGVVAAVLPPRLCRRHRDQLPCQPEKRAIVQLALAAAAASAGPVTLHGDVGMRAAGIVRVGGADDAHQPAPAVVRDDDLAMVGLEVEQPRPGAERDRPVALIQRIREPAAVACAASPSHQRDSEPPQARVEEVGIAQRIQIRDHDLTPAPAAGCRSREGTLAVDLIDRVGDEQDLQVRVRPAPLDQRVAQLAGDARAERRRQRRAMPRSVEQEVVQDDEAVRAERMTLAGLRRRSPGSQRAGRRHPRR